MPNIDEVCIRRPCARASAEGLGCRSTGSARAIAFNTYLRSPPRPLMWRYGVGPACENSMQISCPNLGSLQKLVHPMARVICSSIIE